MIEDLREAPEFLEVEAAFAKIQRPGSGMIYDAMELDVSQDGTRALFAGRLVTKKGTVETRIFSVDMKTGAVHPISQGRTQVRLPKYSPNGQLIAFLSDDEEAGNFQLFLADLNSHAEKSVFGVDGWIEDFSWSPDGLRILLTVAEHGADRAGASGAIASSALSHAAPDWMPDIDNGDQPGGWRRLWIYHLADDRLEALTIDSVNVWNAVWCGNDRIAAITSDGPSENAWYQAKLAIVEVASERVTFVYEPSDQFGSLAASPSGAHIAFVEALCSDRDIAAGNLLIYSVDTATLTVVHTGSVDVTYVEWIHNDMILFAGVRGLTTVVATSTLGGEGRVVWESQELSSGGFGVSVRGLGSRGDFALIAEGFLRSPEIAVVRNGKYHTVKSFDLGYDAFVSDSIDRVCPVDWNAPDGLKIEGWLLRPKGSGPFPVVMVVHGGPVFHWRSFFLGRRSLLNVLLPLHGYAVFLPNPRGSSGRGRDFVAKVLGDMGGADMHDCLSGLDHLAAENEVDPARLGVTGISYGGFMTSWLVTQDTRFAAAVSVSPMNNYVTQHLLSNVPAFASRFLRGSLDELKSQYFSRSPVLHAAKVRTPILHICGALDRCTPPQEAIQFHRALLENGSRSQLAIYPKEGHGVRAEEALRDYVTRSLLWFKAHIPPPPSSARAEENTSNLQVT